MKSQSNVNKIIVLLNDGTTYYFENLDQASVKTKFDFWVSLTLKIERFFGDSRLQTMPYTTVDLKVRRAIKSLTKAFNSSRSC